MNYSNPSIVEALCEFRFASSDDWDSTLYGALWGAVKNHYPKKEERKQVTMAFQINKDGAQEPPSMSEVSHMLFKSNDEKTLIQLQPNVLTINNLEPYQGWINFKPLILKAYNDFNNLGAFNLERIGLRYINRIHLSDNNKPENSISESQFIPKAILEHSSGFHSRVSIPKDKNRIQVQAGAEAEGSSFILDIDSSREENFETIQVEELLEELHANLIDAYECSITDNLRKIMGTNNA